MSSNYLLWAADSLGNDKTKITYLHSLPTASKVDFA